jgi:hypothetical protein
MLSSKLLRQLIGFQYAKDCSNPAHNMRAVTCESFKDNRNFICGGSFVKPTIERF